MTEKALTKRQRLEGTLLSKGFSERYKRALPAQLREKMTVNQAAVTICRAADKNPKILDCSPASIMESLLDAATLGLELAGPMHHAALVPYGSTCQMQIEYPGLIELMYRTGKVESVKVGVVHENDRWSFNQAGTQPPIHEVPWDNRGEPIGVYAIIYLKDGGFTPVVMSKSEVEAHRDKFAMKHGKLSPAWTGSFWAMAQKTALRQVSKWIPKSKELADAIQMVDAELAGDQVHVALDLQPEPPPEANEPASRADQIKAKLAANDDEPIEAQYSEANAAPQKPSKGKSQGKVANQGSNGSDGSESSPKASSDMLDKLVEEAMVRKTIEDPSEALPVFSHLLRKTLVTLEDLTERQVSFLMERL